MPAMKLITCFSDDSIASKDYESKVAKEVDQSRIHVIENQMLEK